MNQLLYKILQRAFDDEIARGIASEVEDEKIFACSPDTYDRIASASYSDVGVDVDPGTPFPTEGFAFYVDETLEDGTLIAFQDFSEYCQHINQQIQKV